jgi:hypothetical protein
MLLLIPLEPEHMLKLGLSRFKDSHFRPHVGDLLLDGAQFGLGPPAHQVFEAKRLRNVRLKLASQDSEIGVAPDCPFPAQPSPHFFTRDFNAVERNAK